MAGTSGTTTKTARATRARSTRAATAKPAARSKPRAAAAKPGRQSARTGGKPAKAKPAVDLQALGARVVSVYGPFDCRVLIEMSTDTARMLFPRGVLAAAPIAEVAEAVQRERHELRARAPELADGSLAAAALAMALEISHPFNSATSKSACARAMQEAMRELRELTPPEEAKDGVDEIAEQRKRRRTGGAAAKG